MKVISLTDSIQLFSFFLECFGISLAILDIFFPHVSEKLECKLDFYSSTENIESPILSFLLTGPIFPLLILLSCVFFWPDAIPNFFQFHVNIVTWLGGGEIYGIILVLYNLFIVIPSIGLGIWAFAYLSYEVIFKYTISLPIKFFNRIANGKALAGIGLVLALLGFLIEVFNTVANFSIAPF